MKFMPKEKLVRTNWERETDKEKKNRQTTTKWNRITAVKPIYKWNADKPSGFTFIVWFGFFFSIPSTRLTVSILASQFAGEILGPLILFSEMQTTEFQGNCEMRDARRQRRCVRPIRIAMENDWTSWIPLTWRYQFHVVIYHYKPFNKIRRQMAL